MVSVIRSQIQTILVGDSEGQVTVYQLRGFAAGSTGQVGVFREKLLLFMFICCFYIFIKLLWQGIRF